MSLPILERIEANSKVINKLTTEVREKIQQVQQVMSSETASPVNKKSKVFEEQTEEMKKLIAENDQLNKEIQAVHRQLTLTQIENGVKVILNPFKIPEGYDPEAAIAKTIKPAGKEAAPKKEEVTSAEATSVPQEGQPQPTQQKESKKKAPKAKPAGGGGGGDSKVEEGAVDVSRLDFRIGKIVQVDIHPDADGLYVEKIDLGEAQPRTIVSGLVKHVPIEQMQNRMVVVLCNLKPSKLRGIVSEGMVMCASSPDKVEVLVPPAGVVPGDVVDFEGFTRNPDAVLNPKKKIWESVAPDLKTNGEKIANYKGIAFQVAGKGIVKAESLVDVQVK